MAWRMGDDGGNKIENESGKSRDEETKNNEGKCGGEEQCPRIPRAKIFGEMGCVPLKDLGRDENTHMENGLSMSKTVAQQTCPLKM